MNQMCDDFIWDSNPDATESDCLQRHTNSYIKQEGFQPMMGQVGLHQNHCAKCHKGVHTLIIASRRDNKILCDLVALVVELVSVGFSRVEFGGFENNAVFPEGIGILVLPDLLPVGVKQSDLHHARVRNLIGNDHRRSLDFSPFHSDAGIHIGGAMVSGLSPQAHPSQQHQESN